MTLRTKHSRRRQLKRAKACRDEHHRCEGGQHPSDSTIIDRDYSGSARGTSKPVRRLKIKRSESQTNRGSHALPTVLARRPANRVEFQRDLAIRRHRLLPHPSRALYSAAQIWKARRWLEILFRTQTPGLQPGAAGFGSSGRHQKRTAPEWGHGCESRPPLSLSV